MLGNFEPTRTLAVLEKIRRDHPQRISRELPPPASLIDNIRRKLLECPSDRLELLATGLGDVHIRAVLQLFVQDDEELVHERCEYVLLRRVAPWLQELMWSALVMHYPLVRLERVIGMAVETRRTDEPAICQNLRRWLSWGKLPEAIVRDYANGELRPFEAWLEERGMPAVSALHRAAWRYVLTQAPTDILRGFPAPWLCERLSSEPMEIQRSGARHYLCTLEKRANWAPTILEWIRKRYGLPLKGTHQREFWKRVPEPVRKEFRRWAMERELEQYFKRVRDPHGRFEFWREFLDEIEEIILPLGDAAMLINFGSFGVAEFSDSGNAAYVYSAVVFRGIASQQHYSVRDLKLYGEEKFRIIHREGWQLNYRPHIEALIRRGR